MDKPGKVTWAPTEGALAADQEPPLHCRLHCLSSLPTTTEPHLPSLRQLPAAPPPGSHVRPTLLPLHFREIMLTM